MLPVVKCVLTLLYVYFCIYQVSTHLLRISLRSPVISHHLKVVGTQGDHSQLIPGCTPLLCPVRVHQVNGLGVSALSLSRVNDPPAHRVSLSASLPFLVYRAFSCVMGIVWKKGLKSTLSLRYQWMLLCFPAAFHCWEVILLNSLTRWRIEMDESLHHLLMSEWEKKREAQSIEDLKYDQLAWSHLSSNNSWWNRFQFFFTNHLRMWPQVVSHGNWFFFLLLILFTVSRGILCIIFFFLINTGIFWNNFLLKNHSFKLSVISSGVQAVLLAVCGPRSHWWWWKWQGWEQRS